MRQIKIVILASVASLLSMNLDLAEAGNYHEYGAGGDSCGKWLEERKTDQWYRSGQWMLGFISAVGYYDVYDLKDTDSLAFAAWMDKYCQEHPLQEFSDGVKELVKELAIK